MTTRTRIPQGQTDKTPTTTDVAVEVDPLADIITGTATPGTLSRVPGGLRAPLWRLIVTSDFGHRVHPVLGTARFHRGIDYGARTGTAVRATAGGTVLWAIDLGPYGNLVVIAHTENVHTAYGHLDEASVTIGQEVRVGQRIGCVGTTGLSTGPHLHFEVRDHGTPVEPTPWVTHQSHAAARAFDALASKLPNFARANHPASQPEGEPLRAALLRIERLARCNRRSSP